MEVKIAILKTHLDVAMSQLCDMAFLVDHWEMEDEHLMDLITRATIKLEELKIHLGGIND